MKRSNFTRPGCNNVFKVSHSKGLIFFTHLSAFFQRVGLSHLREHKFEHCFLDTVNPISISSFNIETLNHFSLHCPRFTNERQNLLHKIENIPNDSNCFTALLKSRFGCSPVNWLHIFRTPFPKNTSEGLLLFYIYSIGRVVKLYAFNLLMTILHYSTFFNLMHR